MWKKGNSYNFLVGNPGGNMSLGRIMLGCHNYTEMVFFTRGEMEDMDWIHVTQDRENSALLLTRLSKLAFHGMLYFLDYQKN